MRMKIILLPGLDGTGSLFDELIKSLCEDHDVEVISYDDVSGRSFIDQANEIAMIIKDTDILLVGESYSGRVAYELSQLLGSRVRAIVFIASFISSPSLLSKFAGLLPVALLKQNFLSAYLLKVFGFNGKATKKQTNSVFNSLKMANRSKLKARFKNIAGLSNPTNTIDCHVTYIRPTRDLLVGKRAVNNLKSLCPNFNVISVSGGHFIAQSAPMACAKVISNAANM